MKAVGFAGFSGSGKTTLVERLIPALKVLFEQTKRVERTAAR